jgi:hypothetical protein
MKSNVVNDHFITYVPATTEDGKFQTHFDMQRGDRDYVMGTLASTRTFDTQADADAAAGRVIAFWNANGKFPNMCEAY